MNAPQSGTPLKIGMFLFEKVMTQRSTPVVVTISPGRIVIAAADRIVADVPAAQVSTKVSRMLKVNELHGPWGKWMLGAVGAARSEDFTDAQATEIIEAQKAAQQDPALAGLELTGTVWAGQPTVADGSSWGALSSMAKGESKLQPRIAPMVDAALLAAGAQRA
ncbi:hypothetical protein [Kytococcus sedentarius]|uniref:hypothetical protein n=1 Tax=Kytococcus sedentarius TaxID=1276 RepID=UPI0035BC46B1